MIGIQPVRDARLDAVLADVTDDDSIATVL
jgi:hypothetical protein